VFPFIVDEHSLYIHNYKIWFDSTIFLSNGCSHSSLTNTVLYVHSYKIWFKPIDTLPLWRWQHDSAHPTILSFWIKLIQLLLSLQPTARSIRSSPRSHNRHRADGMPDDSLLSFLLINLTSWLNTSLSKNFPNPQYFWRAATRQDMMLNGDSDSIGCTLRKLILESPSDHMC